MTKKMKSLIEKIRNYKTFSKITSKKCCYKVLYEKGVYEKHDSFVIRNAMENCYNLDDDEGYEIMGTLQSMSKRKRKIVLFETQYE